MLHYRSKQPMKKITTSARALKYANGKSLFNNQLIAEVDSGLPVNSPILCEEGTGGTYFLKNKNNKTAAVFKPKDEDPLSPNNPKNIIVQGFSGFKTGDGIFREVFAHELDPSLVPETCIAEIKHSMFTTPKVGSLQKFIQGAESTEEYGPSLYSAEDVQRIALLDVRIVNCDRNGENILVKRENNKCRLIPIDHAFSLPTFSSFDNLNHFEWMNYRQSKLPMSQEIKDIIQNIDIEKDVTLAKTMGIRRECTISLQIAHIILMKAVAANKSFFDIGCFMCSKDLHTLCQRYHNSSNISQLLDDVSALASSYFQ